MNENDVLRAVRRLIDGSQPKDLPGAVMAIDTALAEQAAPDMPPLPLELDKTEPRLSFRVQAGELARAIRQYGSEVYRRALSHAAQAASLDASWTPATTPPDADTTVMLALADGEVWQGYFDGVAWIEVSGLALAPGRVTYWQHTPKHPEDRA